jgi:ubiquitin-protein ligase
VNLAAAPAADASVCSICQSPVQAQEPTSNCPACQTRYHADCWQENGGCAVYGCTEVPKVEQRRAIEIPMAYWGQEEKPCPGCGRKILAAAVRCRHCGATFASARPEDASEFRDRTVLESRIPAMKRSVVWIFVFSTVPCFAPIGAIWGLIWFLTHRRSLGALPGVYVALSKIGLALAWGQCARADSPPRSSVFPDPRVTTAPLSPKPMSARLRRLTADFEKVQAAFAQHPFIRVLRVEGTPPDRYTFGLYVEGLVPTDDSQFAQGTEHHAEVFLPLDYPRRPPFCRMLTPVYHPNIDPQKICIGDHWSAGQSLPKLVVRIAEMICYQSYNLKSPLNAAAAVWAEQNLEALPLQPDDLSTGL